MTERDLVHLIDRRVEHFDGQLDELESAIGMLMIARHYGWKVIYLIHTRKTVQKYEKILDISLRDIVPPVGRIAKRSVAWRLMDDVGNFWKAVKGEIPGIRTSEASKPGR